MTQHGRAIGKAKVCPACRESFGLGVVNCPADGTLLDEVDPLIGQVMDGLEVIEFIGQGGMSLVYKARHQVLERFVAIKMLKGEYLSEVVNVQRFRREGQAACRLQHPNVNAIHNVGVSPTGQPYLVLEFLSGPNLSTVIEKEKPLNFQRVIGLFDQITDGLAHAHERGVIHRDLKPSNIVITEDAQGQELVKIVDFGTAKFLPQISVEKQQLTQTGDVLGTLRYMSPEQKSGQEIDARSDIYAVGYMLFEALEKDGTVPESVRWIVDKATAYSPADRFRDINAFRDALVALSKPSFQKVSARNWQPVRRDQPSKKLSVMFAGALVAVGLTAVALPFCLNDIDKARLHHVWIKMSGAKPAVVLNSADDLASKIIDGHGNAREAEQVYKNDALPLLDQFDVRTKARIYFGLGRAYCRMNNIDEARVFAKQIGTLLTAMDGKHSSDWLPVLWYRQQLLVEANSSEPILVSKLDNLLTVAVECEKAGLLDEADAVYAKAVDIAGRSNLYNAFQLKGLGYYLHFCERNHRTEKIFPINERMMALLEQAELVDDPQYAMVRLTHGRFLQDNGRVREADILFKAVLDSLPANHPAIPEAWIDLGVVTKLRARLDLSEHYLMLAADMDEGLSDAQYARLYCELANIRRRDAEFDNAVECLKRVYSKLGDKVFDMPECATLPDELMFCLMERKRTQEALVIGKQAVQVCMDKKLGKPFLMWRVAFRVGEVYMDRHDFEKAKYYLRIALDGADTNAYRASITAMIGENYKLHGEPVVAEQYFRKAMRLGAESSSPSYVLLTFRCQLIEALLDQGRLDEAKAIMDDIAKSLGNQIFDPPNVVGVLAQLRIYDVTGKYQEYLRFCREAIRRREEVAPGPSNEMRALKTRVADMEKRLAK